MSLNITVATPKLLICATDRRLVDFRSGRVVTERSAKSTALFCADALALITYNGIGRAQSGTPSDWLQALETQRRLSGMRFRDVLQTIREDVQVRVRSLPEEFRRHTFVFGAWGRGQTWIVVISNYESASDDQVAHSARSHFDISALAQERDAETRVLVTGASQDFDAEESAMICRVARKAGATGIDIKNLCVKAIQKVGKKKRRGVVGTSVLWAIAERYKGIESGLDVLGGTSVHEILNVISPTLRLKDVRIEAPKGQPLSFGKPFPLPEESCKHCGNPVPLGYARCEVCGHMVAAP